MRDSFHAALIERPASAFHAWPQSLSASSCLKLRIKTKPKPSLPGTSGSHPGSVHLRLIPIVVKENISLEDKQLLKFPKLSLSLLNDGSSLLVISP